MLIFKHISIILLNEYTQQAKQDDGDVYLLVISCIIMHYHAIFNFWWIYKQWMTEKRPLSISQLCQYEHVMKSGLIHKCTLALFLT